MFVCQNLMKNGQVILLLPLLVPIPLILLLLVLLLRHLPTNNTIWGGGGRYVTTDQNTERINKAPSQQLHLRQEETCKKSTDWQCPITKHGRCHGSLKTSKNDECAILSKKARLIQAKLFNVQPLESITNFR